MRNPTRLALAAVALAGLGTAAAITVHQPRASAGTFQDQSLGFRDQTSGAYLRIDLQAGDPGLGQFYFTAPGTGLARPAGVASVSPTSAHDVQFRYDSNGSLNATGDLSSDFDQPQATGASTPATIRLIGHVDPAHQTATVEVWINGQHFNLTASPAPQTAATTLAAVLKAMRATDLGGLYDVADPSLRGGLTRDQFVAKVATTGTGSVTAVTVLGATTYLTTSAGVDFALTPVTLSYTSNGTPASVQAHIRLIFTGGQWRYMTVQPDTTPANHDNNAPDDTIK
jgi:hypothetical protein